MNQITRERAVSLINETNGKIFTVVFIKRTTGEKRLMNCRTNVKKELKGKGPKYDFGEKDLISVFDMQIQQYRTISIEGLLEVKIDGQNYTIIS